MRCRFFGSRLRGAYVAFLLNTALTLSCAAGTLQLVSVIDPTQIPPATGSGDSVAPLLSADGRYVLFAGTAKNLIVNSNGNAMAGTFPARFNVFRRDRTNGTTSLVSVNSSGSDGGNGDSLPAGISEDGRFALFESRASDLVEGDANQASDIFVRDLSSNRTVLVSASIYGGVGNGDCRSAVMTPDARFVAFVSAANNLVADDTNGIADVFVRDLQSNVTTLVSPGANAVSAPGVTASESPLITPDGHYVAFYSTATNLVAGPASGPNIYVRDLFSGTTIWANVAASNIVGTNAFCFSHAISADGQFIAYGASSRLRTGGAIARYNLQTGVTDLVHTNAAVAVAAYEDIRSLDMTPDGRFIAFVANTNTASTSNTCILIWDGQVSSLSLASGDLNGAVPPNSICDWPAIDSTGRFVAFLSSASNLTTNSLTGDYHLYVHDFQSEVTTLVDADTNGVGSIISPVTIPRLSANGQMIAFEAPDANLVPNDRNHDFDVFVRDLSASASELISARNPGLPSLTPDGLSTLFPGSANMDGRYVAFSSEADNLVPNDTNGVRDVFVRDLAGSANILISMATNGAVGDGLSTEPSISADGRYVAFTSRADNLVPGDTNNTSDVFLRDALNGTTSLVSVSTNGVTPGNNLSYSPVLSADAKYVLFRSKAGNLVSSPVGWENLFLRNVQSGMTYALTAGGVDEASMTADGRFVFFFGSLGGTNFDALYLWDSQLNARVYTNTTFSYAAGVSPDGNRLIYATSGQFYAVDRAAKTVRAIGPLNYSSDTGVFSADSRFLVYPVELSSRTQVYLYDFLGENNLLLSHSFDSGAAANDSSGFPTISSDGRFVAYRSAATNIVAGDTNGCADVFLYDRANGITTLLSTNLHGSGSDNFSLSPVFSGDGRVLFFQSWASNLMTNDFNGSSDIFAYGLYNTSFLPAFSATIAVDVGSADAFWLSWPLQPGTTYRVQFKNSLTDAQWQELEGTVQVVGTQAFLRDVPASNVQRFYRIVAY